MNRCSTALVLLLLVLQAPALAQEIVSDFRRDTIDKGEFNWDGLKAESFIRPEAQGLRWRFTPKSCPNRAVGISWKTRLDGDFTATARYEILSANCGGQGAGVGAEMYLTLNTAEPREAIVFTRVVHPGGDSSVNLTYMTNSNDDKKYRFGKLIARQAVGPQSAKGRMRLMRDGKIFAAFLAEGESDEFREIGRLEIGDVRVLKVRFAGLEGGSPAASLDMRLLDFQLTEKKLVTKLADTKPSPPPPPREPTATPIPADNPTSPANADTGRARLWIVIALIGVVALLVLTMLGFLVASRLKGNTVAAPAAKKKRGDS